MRVSKEKQTHQMNNNETTIWGEVIKACLSLPDVKIRIIEVTNNPQNN